MIQSPPLTREEKDILETILDIIGDESAGYFDAGVTLEKIEKFVDKQLKRTEQKDGKQL